MGVTVLAKEDVTEKVIAVIIDRMGTYPDEISQDSKIVKDLGAESIDVLDLLFSWGQEFDLKLPDSAIDEIMGFPPIHGGHRFRLSDFSVQEQEQISDLLTVRKVADYICSKLEIQE